jgi:hypothetical protein
MTVQSVVIDRSASASTEPAGHQQAMIEKIESLNNPADPNPAESTSADPEASSWLPEKFKSAEDLAKAYAELEAKQSGKQQEPQEPQAKTQAPTEQQAQDELKSKEPEPGRFTREFNEKGALSQESYDKLLAAGFDKALVDSYIEGQRAVGAQYESQVFQEAGGQESYTEMVTWAKTNLTPAEQDAYNAAVSSGNVAQAKLAVAGLKARFRADNGNEPALIGGRNSAAQADVFESTEQMTEAMRDPRYRKDPAYRAAVQAKLARSNIF